MHGCVGSNGRMGSHCLSLGSCSISCLCLLESFVFAICDCVNLTLHAEHDSQGSGGRSPPLLVSHIIRM